MPTTRRFRNVRRVARYTAFNTFLDGLTGDIYPEVPAEPHLSITKAKIDALHRDGMIIAGMRVLDVGCGQGVAMDKFRDLSLEAVGITLGADGDLCRAKHLDVREMDQNSIFFGVDTSWSTASRRCLPFLSMVAF